MLEATIFYSTERGRFDQSKEKDERLLGRQRVAVADNAARNAVEVAKGLHAEVAALKAELARARAAAAPPGLVMASVLAEVSLAPAVVFTDPPTHKPEEVAAAATKTANDDAVAMAMAATTEPVSLAGSSPASSVFICGGRGGNIGAGRRIGDWNTIGASAWACSRDYGPCFRRPFAFPLGLPQDRKMGVHLDLGLAPARHQGAGHQPLEDPRR